MRPQSNFLFLAYFVIFILAMIFAFKAAKDERAKVRVIQGFGIESAYAVDSGSGQ